MSHPELGNGAKIYHNHLATRLVIPCRTVEPSFMLLLCTSRPLHIASRTSNLHSFLFVNFIDFGASSMGRSIDIVVAVTYSRGRAKELFDHDKKEFARLLRKDLDRLRLPHPPEANISWPPDETKHKIKFWWNSTMYSVSLSCSPQCRANLTSQSLYNIIDSVVIQQNTDPYLMDMKERVKMQVFMNLRPTVGLTPLSSRKIRLKTR